MFPTGRPRRWGRKRTPDVCCAIVNLLTWHPALAAFLDRCIRSMHATFCTNNTTYDQTWIMSFPFSCPRMVWNVTLSLRWYEQLSLLVLICFSCAILTGMETNHKNRDTETKTKDELISHTHTPTNQHTSTQLTSIEQEHVTNSLLCDHSLRIAEGCDRCHSAATKGRLAPNKKKVGRKRWR